MGECKLFVVGNIHCEKSCISADLQFFALCHICKITLL